MCGICQMQAAVFHCDCQKFLCAGCLPDHQCLPVKVGRIQQSFDMGSRTQAPLEQKPCPKLCELTLGIVSWNINHFSELKLPKRRKPTAEKIRDDERKQRKWTAKVDTVKRLLNRGDVDAIALQEVNPTGVPALSGQLTGLGAVLHPGPLLCTQSWQSRQSFANRYMPGEKTANKPPTAGDLSSFLKSTDVGAAAVHRRLCSQIYKPRTKSGQVPKNPNLRSDQALKTALRLLTWCQSGGEDQILGLSRKVDRDKFKQEFAALCKKEPPVSHAVSRNFVLSNPEQDYAHFHPQRALKPLLEGLKQVEENLDLDQVALEMGAWGEAVRKMAKAVKAKKGQGKAELRQKSLSALQVDFPSAEAFYRRTRALSDRYQENYPLLTKPGVSVDKLLLYWGTGAVDECPADFQGKVYYKGPGTEELLETTKEEEAAEEEAAEATEGESDDEPEGMEEGDGQDPDGSGEKEEEAEEPEADTPETRYRPVVVYQLRKKCGTATGCVSPDCPPALLGVVHTSPAGKEFRRDAIFQNQLKKVFQQAKTSPYWVFAGDYYLTPEAIVELQGGKTPPNVHRNTEGMSFERNLPEQFGVVTPSTATNPGNWKPRYKTPLDSVTVQIADFAVCSMDWAVSRAFTVDTRTGAPLVVDNNHVALQQMSEDDSSDHLPVYVFVSRYDATATLIKTLAYPKGAAELTDEANRNFKSRKRKFEDTLEEQGGEGEDAGEQKGEKGGGLRIEGGMGRKMIKGARTLRNESKRLLLQQLPPTLNVGVLDFDPDFSPCQLAKRRKLDTKEEVKQVESESESDESFEQEVEEEIVCSNCGLPAGFWEGCNCQIVAMCGNCLHPWNAGCMVCGMGYLQVRR